MNHFLSHLLEQFDKQCKKLIKIVDCEGLEADVRQIIRKNCQIQENEMKPNCYVQATGFVPSAYEGEQNETFTMSKHFIEKLKLHEDLNKIKENMLQDSDNQKTPKTTKKLPPNRKQHQQNCQNIKKKCYKPNSMFHNIFSQNDDFKTYLNETLSEEDELKFFNTLTSLPLKQRQEKKNFPLEPSYDEVEKQSITLYNPRQLLMAPKKQKLKKIKSNQQYQ